MLFHAHTTASATEAFLQRGLSAIAELVVYLLDESSYFNIFNFIRRDQNDSSKTIIRKKNNINQNKPQITVNH